MAFEPTTEPKNGAATGFRISRLLSGLSTDTTNSPAADTPSPTPSAPDFAEAASSNAAPAVDAGQMIRRSSSGGVSSQALGDLRDELGQSRAELLEMRGMIGKLLERKPLDQTVFDALHVELKSYKDDFFYEHLKPTVRSFLFVCDAIDDFENELQVRQQDGLCTDAATLQLTLDNLVFFRQQLRDALVICETFEVPTDGEFDPLLHRAISTTKAAPGEPIGIVQVMRGGWTLGGKVLRPADVVRRVSA